MDSCVSEYTFNNSFYHATQLTSFGRHKLEWGANVISSSAHGISSFQMEKNLQTLYSLGGNVATFVPIEYQSSASSAYIFGTDSSPSIHAIRRAILFSKRIGLKTSLKPHVNLMSKESRSKISPLDFDVWADNYQNYILRYAQLAEELGVDSFYIGTELESVSGNEVFWRRLIRSVRKVYQGEVSYSSNRLNEANKIKWWDDLDFIGISFYEPLLTSTTEVVTEDALVASWYYRGYVLNLLQLNEKWNKYIVLSELGYYGRVDVNVNPAIISEGRIDSRVQAISYMAAFKVLSSLPQVKAFYVWALDANSISPPGGFSIIPTNKDVMCALKAKNTDDY